MQVDITKVEAIHQDFTNRKIRVLDKYNFCMWKNSYTNEKTFNKVFSEISRKFSAELRRRENEMQSM